LAGGGDEGGDAEVVELAGQAEAGAMETSEGVVGEEGFLPARQLEAVSDVADGLLEVHGLYLVAGGDSLVEGGIAAHAELAGEHGLADEEESEVAAAVHLGRGEKAQLLELVGAEQVGLIDGEDDPSATFQVLHGEQGLGLGHDLGLEEAGLCAEGADDGDIQTPCTDQGVWEVDDVERGWVERVGGGADGDGLADADLAGDDADESLGDAEAEAGDGLLMAGALYQV
jgi:hypothetical protein